MYEYFSIYFTQVENQRIKKSKLTPLPLSVNVIFERPRSTKKDGSRDARTPQNVNSLGTHALSIKKK